MKSFFKKNKLTIISFFILILWGVITLLSCIRDTTDPLILYFHMFADKNLYYLEILAPLFVIVPGIYQFHKELNTGFIKNCLTRTKYKKYLISHYFNALKKIWILPLFYVLMILFCCIYLKSFNFGSGAEYYGYYTGSPDLKYASCIFSFMLTYFINLILQSILYLNVGLIYCKKYSNFLISLILSYLTFIILDIFLEVFIGNLLFARILNIHNITDSLNLFNFWTYHNVISLQFSIIYSLFLCILSLVMIMLIYKSEEGVIIEIEK